MLRNMFVCVKITIQRKLYLERTNQRETDRERERERELVTRLRLDCDWGRLNARFHLAREHVFALFYYSLFVITSGGFFVCCLKAYDFILLLFVIDALIVAGFVSVRPFFRIVWWYVRWYCFFFFFNLIFLLIYNKYHPPYASRTRRILHYAVDEQNT